MIKYTLSCFLSKRTEVHNRINLFNTKRAVTSKCCTIIKCNCFLTNLSLLQNDYCKKMNLISKKNQIHFFSTSSQDSSKLKEQDTRFDKFFKRATIKKREFLYQLNSKLLDSEIPSIAKAKLLLDQYYEQFKLFNPFSILSIKESLQIKLDDYYEKNKIILQVDKINEIPLKIFLSFFWISIKDYLIQLSKNLFLFLKINWHNWKEIDIVLIRHYLYLLYYYKKHIYLTNTFYKMIQFLFIMPLQIYQDISLSKSSKSIYNNNLFDFHVYLNKAPVKLKHFNLNYKYSFFSNLYRQLNRIKSSFQ